MKIFEADALLARLEPLLKETKGIAAYALSKNYRLLSNELIDYNNMKQDLFRKYGYEKDGYITIDKETDNYNKFIEEMDMFKDEEISVEFRKLSEEDIVNSGLNGEEMLLVSKYFEE